MKKKLTDLVNSKGSYKWTYCSLGGTTRVNIACGADIAHLRELDEKMWTVLSCPVKGLEMDERTLDLIDFDRDGKIRVEEVVAAAEWLCSVLKDPNTILLGHDFIDLADFNTENEEGVKLQESAKQVLKIMGLNKTTISLAELNEFLAHYDEECQNQLKESLDALTVATAPYGDKSDDAVAAVNALRDKVADYFMRCKFIQFHDDCAAALDVSVEKVAAISDKNLSTSLDEISSYPISRPIANAVLPINEGINPAWQDAFGKVKSLVLDVDYPGKESINEEEWNAVVAKIDAYVAAKADEEKAINDSQVEKVNDEHAVIEPLERLLHLYRDFYTLLRNYVMMTDFYDLSKQAIFQAGKLYIDSRCLNLCMKVSDVAKHMDGSKISGMFLLYCKCTSKVKNATMDIVAVLTDGEVNNVRVGKNAVFYDNDGQDWDAVITQIVDNPISIREAFWSPYRKFGRWVTEKLSKSAQEKEAKSFDNLTAKADSAAATIGKDGKPVPAADTKKAFDIAKFAGIFAAIGLALGFVLQALTGVFKVMFSSFFGFCLVVVVVMLCISGPSMFLAWLKLRNRNLGPVLNANGWAINSKILVNTRFGATLTDMAKYPKIVANDPYAVKSMPKWLRWVLFVLVVLVVVFLVLYFNNYFDRFGIEALHYDKDASFIGKIFGKMSEEMTAVTEGVTEAVTQASAPAETAAAAPAEAAAPAM